ncbi:hypothetical protein [Paenibacillus nasutitermitis]|uniref:Uncharacterized protein n=1 Tax=Paenibacillus nasutitermitis TaxID=1652958 RepID=A0A916ZED7_9BACL|nr:hypothetical protein [Paenibacillus nasutitermitis]GGD89621.1 hypothetical protein GCM10010911_55300 [Paenibacillus nasutitermitis]
MGIEASIYKQARKLKLGKAALEPEFSELARVLKDKLGIEMIHAVYDLMDTTPRLHIIVNTTEQYVNMHQKGRGRFGYNKNIQKLIVREFSRITREIETVKNYETDNLFVCYTDFEHEAKTAANSEISIEIREKLFARHKEIWQVVSLFTTITVFYLTDVDLEQNAASGVNEEIKAFCYEALKRADEFDYYTESNLVISFDTKENVDNNYEGNLYYYFK